MGKFVLERNKKERTPKKHEVVKVNAEAYNALVEMSNTSGLPLAQIASKCILYAFENMD